MIRLSPKDPEELAAALGESARAHRTIQLAGNDSKQRMGGHSENAEVRIDSAMLNRILRYEPNDLTISVQAGVRWADLCAALDANRQMIPLDPVCWSKATVGGVVAANTAGPRRRLYGSVRDAVIGMTFATMEGRLVQSGGMVVKNVAGLDMGKLMIGSYGTLAAIAVVNFKVMPSPEVTETFLFHRSSMAATIEIRNRILESVLQPVAIDLLNPHAAALLGYEGWVLAVHAGGSARVVERYRLELDDADQLSGDAQAAFWEHVREFVPQHLNSTKDGAVVRISVVLQDVGATMEEIPVPALARAGNGVIYCCFPDVEAATRWLAEQPAQGVVEWIPPRSCSGSEQWPRPGDDFEVMKKVKQMLDPEHLLNRGRLYGRI